MECRALAGGLRGGGMECRAFGRLRETTARGFLSQTLTFPGMEQMGLRKFRGKACGRGRMWFREFPFILLRLRLTALKGRLRSRLTCSPPFTGFGYFLAAALTLSRCAVRSHAAARSAATASHPLANKRLQTA